MFLSGFFFQQTVTNLRLGAYHKSPIQSDELLYKNGDISSKHIPK